MLIAGLDGPKLLYFNCLCYKQFLYPKCSKPYNKRGSCKLLSIPWLIVFISLYTLLPLICFSFTPHMIVQDVMLCGGSDAAIIPIGIYPLFVRLKPCTFFFKVHDQLYLSGYTAGLGGFVACRALSQRNSDPTKASRPWDVVSIEYYVFTF